MNKRDLVKSIKDEIKRDPASYVPYEDWFSFAKNEKDHKMCKELRSALVKGMGEFRNYEYGLDLYKRTLLFDAPVDLDCYFRYMEFERSNKFYAPRRKQLKPVIDALQDMYDDKSDLVCISMPPGTGKTTVALWYCTWLAGKQPELGNIIMSHSKSFLSACYEECLKLMTEYPWGEVFPNRKIAKTNANDLRIAIDENDRFPTFQFASCNENLAGKIRGQGLLYCDDLITDSEEAFSMPRLESKWVKYTTDIRQRKEGNCKELHIATRWSVHDIIGRIQDVHKDDDRAVFIAMPALDENDESNFDYPCDGGFTTEFYRDIRDQMDEVSWQCLYMNEPVEREGILFNRNELQRFYEPPEQYDATIAVCDTSNGGGDYCVMPIFRVVGDQHYMVDCVCSNKDQQTRDTLCANAILKWGVERCQFESNNGGGRTADVVERMIKEKGSKCQIQKKWSQSNKATRIVVTSPFILNNCWFLDDSRIARGSQYADFIKQMCNYTQTGKNVHDDVPDALSQYVEFTEHSISAKAVLIDRFFKF